MGQMNNLEIILITLINLQIFILNQINLVKPSNYHSNHNKAANNQNNPN